MDKVNDELLMLISGNKTQPARNFKVVRQSTVPLTFNSSPGEVASWLNAKGFSKPWVKCSYRELLKSLNNIWFIIYWERNPKW